MIRLHDSGIPAILLALLFSGSVVMLPIPRLPVAHQAPISFSLYGRVSNPNGWGFTASAVSNPGPTVSVSSGDSVTLNLFSADGISHRFCVDYESTPDFSCTSTELSTESAVFSSSSVATTVTFTAPATPGTYSYFCTIHTSGMTGSFTVNPATADFSLSANPESISIVQGGSGTSSIKISAQNGFTGSVNLSAGSNQPGLVFNMDPSMVSLTMPTATSIVTVNASDAVPNGAYQATVTGTNGTLSRTTTLTVMVTSPASNSSSINLLTGVIGVVAIVLVLGGVVLRVRRSRSHAK